MKSWIIYCFRLFLGLVALVLTINVAILIYADEYIVKIDQLPKTSYGMILGASVYRDGTLSPVLRERVDMAIAAYQQGFFDYFFVSGDEREGYGEVQAIVAYLHEQGIDDAIIMTDGKGMDTYDSMWRAKHHFGIDSLLIFTQAFHLSRSVYIARKLDIEAIGVSTDTHVFPALTWLNLREVGARVKAFVEVEIMHALPAYP